MSNVIIEWLILESWALRLYQTYWSDNYCIYVQALQPRRGLAINGGSSERVHSLIVYVYMSVLSSELFTFLPSLQVGNEGSIVNTDRLMSEVFEKPEEPPLNHYSWEDSSSEWKRNLRNPHWTITHGKTRQVSERDLRTDTAMSVRRHLLIRRFMYWYHIYL